MELAHATASPTCYHILPGASSIQFFEWLVPSKLEDVSGTGLGEGLVAGFPGRKNALAHSYGPDVVVYGDVPVAQLDRASDYGSEGSGFESLRVRQLP